MTRPSPDLKLLIVDEKNTDKPAKAPQVPQPEIDPGQNAAGLKVLPVKPISEKMSSAPIKKTGPLPQKPPTQTMPIAPPSDLTEATSYAQATMGTINKNALPSFGQKTEEKEETQAPQQPQMSVKPVGIFSGFLKNLLLLILFILIVAGAGLALAYTNYKYFKPPLAVQKAIDLAIILAPVPKTPRIILAKTQSVMSAVKTATISTEIAAATTNASFPVKEAKLTVKGPFEFGKEAKNKSEFDISGSVKTEGLSASAAGSLKFIDNYIYFKITEFPGGAFLGDSLKNKWFYFKIEEEMDETKKEDFSQKVQKAVEIIQNFTANSYTWTTQEDAGETFSLTLKPPKEELSKLFTDLSEVFEDTDQTKGEQALARKSIQDAIDKLKDITIVIKVAKSDYLIREAQYKVSMEIESPNFSAQSGVSLAPTTTLPIDITTTMSFSNYNDPVIVEVPEGAEDVNKYMEQWQKDLEKSLENQDFLKPQENPQGTSGTFNQKGPVLGEKESLLNLWLKSLVSPT